MFRHKRMTAVLAMAAMAGSPVLLPGISLAEELQPLPDSATSFEIAQIPPYGFGFPAPPAVIPGNQRSITVTGTGFATVPAEQAVLFLLYYQNYVPDYSNPNQPPAPPPPISLNDAQPIVNALTSAGAAANQVEAYLDPSSVGTIRIRVTLDRPSSDRVVQLVNAANTAATQNGKFAPSGTYVGYSIQDCSAPETQARQMAMDSARTRANGLAGVAGVELGNVLSLSDYTTWGYFPTCPSTSTISTLLANPYALPPFDPSAPAEVRLDVSITASFEIEE